MNHKNDSLKVILLVIVVLVLGFGIRSWNANRVLSQGGLAYVPQMEVLGTTSGTSTQEILGPEDLQVTCNGLNPSLTVIKPKSGKTLNAGEIYTFKWKPCNLGADGYANVSLYNQAGTSQYYIGTTGVNINDKTITYKINPYFAAGSYLVRVFCTQPNSEASCTPLGSEDYSGAITLNTPALHPIINSESATSITSHSAQITIGYSKNDGTPSTGIVHYGIGNMSSSTNTVPLNNAVNGKFIFTLTNLTANTTYQYVGNIMTPAYGTALAATQTFTTLP